MRSRRLAVGLALLIAAATAAFAPGRSGSLATDLLAVACLLPGLLLVAGALPPSRRPLDPGDVDW